MLEVALVSESQNSTYQWADGVESLGISFRHVTQEQFPSLEKRYSALVTSGITYDDRPHIFWLDENTKTFPENIKIFATPKCASKISANPNITILGPIIGPRHGNGIEIGVCGSPPQLNLPIISVNDPKSLSKCGVVVVTEADKWTEGFEAACKCWGLIVVTGQNWVKPHINWIVIDPKWGWEKAVREGMKRLHSKEYADALKRAGMMPTGVETLAAAVRRAIPTPNNPISPMQENLISNRARQIRQTQVQVVQLQQGHGKQINYLSKPQINNEPVVNEIIKPSEIVKTEYKNPEIIDLTPSWFKNEPTNVSVIVPMWKSSSVIDALIKSFDFSCDCEIIFVSDACPQNSHQTVIASLTNKTPNAKVLVLSSQGGFATACNAGAKFAKGKYIIFLNADTTVTPGWIDAIIQPLSNSENGLVGNLQLKMDGTIDSAGSQWMKQTRSFEHIGRNIWKDKRMTKRIKPHEAPKEMLEDGPRQMVTGCCIALEKDFFDQIGGFDIGYRIAYWEDACICMKVKQSGKKVYFTSKSVIYHKGSHSNSYRHPYIKENAQRFYSKWINTEFIEKI